MEDVRLRRIIKLLTPSRAQHEAEASAALKSLSFLALSYVDAESIESLIEALLSAYPGCPFLEFVLANDQTTRNLVIQGLSPYFTLPLDLFLQSLAFKIIKRLHDFYISLPADGAPQKLDEAHLAISEDLVTLSSPTKGPSQLRGAKEDDFPSKRTAKQSHNKKLSKSSRAPGVLSINPKAFQGFGGGKISHTSIEVNKLAGKLLLKQMHILELYMSTLGDVNTRRMVKQIYTGVGQQSVSGEGFVNQPIGANRINASMASTKVDPSYNPSIRPMRAADYFASQGQDLGEWPILVSSRTLKQIRQLATKDAAIFEIVRKKIMELSEGFFSDSNQKKLVGGDNEVPVFEAKMTRDLRLVYQVDCGPFKPPYSSDAAVKHDLQMIRIYGIRTHAQIDKRLWTSVAYHSTNRGSEYRRRCIYREIPRVKTKGQNVTPPAKFPHDPMEEENLAPGPPDSTLGDADYLELHSILTLEKSIPYYQTLLDKIRHSENDTHEFLVSEHEEQVIHHPSSSLIIGRSGTGKTTTMLFKMLAYERGAEDAHVEVRQVFVTQSRVLASRVKEYFQDLLATSQPLDMNSDPSPSSGAASKMSSKDEGGLLDLDEDFEPDIGLPARWSELEDHHFPLFVTFNQLCNLLEADLGIGCNQEEFTPDQPKAKQRYNLKDVEGFDLGLGDVSSDPAPRIKGSSQTAKQLVTSIGPKKTNTPLTYETFISTVWRKFDQRVVKHLDPVLVFGEFMGVIKGHELTLGTSKGYLDRQTYEELSGRAQATFASVRPTIYSLFESYLQRKAQLGCRDAPDRTHALLKGLADGLPGEKVDFLYVDEAQDNLIIDARLLRALCRTPHGLCFGGDTAQTIAVGSSFRFDDLKAFLWRLEESDPLVKGRKREAIHPTLFQLSVNYRSHAGIVDAATCVVGIITKLFPGSIDSLAPERSLIAGPKPIFFHSSGDVRYEQFLSGEANSKIEFGAEQVILVRNGAARAALRKEIGREIGLVLTVYESKGLEFGDVLLYNFFEDSAATESDWSVVLNYLGEESRAGIRCPRLNETKHATIQSELKFLYVGLTRARRHIWIWDSSAQADAMMRLWSSKDLIKVHGPNDPMPKLTVSSTPADWSKRGRLLFSKRLFDQAKYCFEKAGLSSEAAIAQAYQLRQEARELPTLDLAAYLEAANHFRACGERALNAKDRIKLHQIAAECYLEARKYCEAAKLFLELGDYTAAALNFRTGNDLDSSVDVIHQHKDEVDPKVAAKITKYAKVVYSREDRIEKVETFFDGTDDHIEFLEDLGLDAARLNLLERLGRFDEAGDMCQNQGDERQAVHYFSRSQNPVSQAKVLHAVLAGLWKNFAFGSTAPDEDRDNEIDAFLALAKSLRNPHDEIEMFREFRAPPSTNTTQKLTNMGRQLADKGNRGGALAALDQALQNPASLQSASLDEFISALAGYQLYGQQIQYISGLRDIPGNADMQKIFSFAGVTNASEDRTNGPPLEYRVPTVSMLHQKARHCRGSREDPADASIIISRIRLSNIVVRVLHARFKAALTRLHGLALKAGSLQPCVEWAVGRRCGRSACWKEHVTAKDMTSEVFNKRVRAFAQLIMVMDFVRPSGPGKRNTREDRQRIWLNMLFDTLHPSSDRLGNLASLNPSLIPEYNNALSLLKTWVAERFYQINPADTNQFVADVLGTSFLAFSLDYEKACQYVPRTPCFTQHRRDPNYIGPQSMQSVVHDCLKLFVGKVPSSLSAGLHFIRRIVSGSKIPVELNVLIHFIERLVIYLVINERIARYGHNGLAFNQLMLPKTWLIHGFARTYPPQSPQKADMLIEPVRQLMEALCFPPVDKTPLDKQYHFAGRTLSRIGPFTRSVFVSRLCRALVLLGSNSHNGDMRDTILNAIRSLGPTERPPHLWYISARTWEAMVMAARTSLDGSPLDEMMRIMYGPKRALAVLPGVRNIFFTSKADLLQKIGFHSSPLPLVSNLNPQAQAFVPHTMAENVEAVSAENGPDQLRALESVGGGSVDGKAEEVREDFAIQRSEAEHQAARCIQLFARRRRDRRVNVGLGGAFFDACLNEVTKLGNSLAARRYRKYYLGPLPHVLTYLNRTTERCLAAKKRFSQRMEAATHDSLDAIIDKVDVTTQLRKDLIMMSRTLSPSSALHKARNVAKLKNAVRGVKKLKERADDIMNKGVVDQDDDYERGMKGLAEDAQGSLREDADLLSDTSDYASEQATCDKMGDWEGDRYQSEVQGPNEENPDGPKAERTREDFATQWTEEDHQAARRIQCLFRRYQDHRAGVGMGGPFFDACSNEVTKSSDSMAARHYRKYYLGPLPHVLTYLNRTTERCVTAKRQLVKQMKTATNESLDAIIDSVDLITQLRKDSIALSKSLGPLSALHKDYSVDNLKNAVRKVQALKGRADDMLNKGIVEQDKDYELGRKGLV